MNISAMASSSCVWHWIVLSFLVAPSLCPLFSAYAAAAAGLGPPTPLPAEAPSSLGHHIAPGVQVQAPERSHGHVSPIPSPNVEESKSAPAPKTLRAPPPSLPPLAPTSAPPSDNPDDSDPDSRTPEEDDISRTITWCAIRDEIEDCTRFVDQLNSAYGYGWICVQRDTAFECMQAIAKGDADLISLDAGLAYVAFMNYRMKAIMQEQYCYFSRSYKAVAIVNKKLCDRNPHLSMRDFRGLGSCHSGYLSAAGWNHPVEFLVESGLQRPPLKLSGAGKGKDEAVVRSFFGKSCAPSELEGRGLCTSCGDNGTCTMDSFKYAGYAGAFQCLVDGTGDIAFVRSDTAERLSADGKHKQDWSTKSIDEFRYLCPQGGCKTINDNIQNCTFGSIIANVLMASNSLMNERRLEVVHTLLNASSIGLLYNPQNWDDHMLSSSTEMLVEIKELTRHVLGDSGLLSQRVENLGQNITTNQLYPNGSPRTISNSHVIIFLVLFLSCLLIKKVS